MLRAGALGFFVYAPTPVQEFAGGLRQYPVQPVESLINPSLMITHQHHAQCQQRRRAQHTQKVLKNGNGNALTDRSFAPALRFPEVCAAAVRDVHDVAEPPGAVRVGAAVSQSESVQAVCPCKLMCLVGHQLSLALRMEMVPRKLPCTGRLVVRAPPS